MPYIFGYGSLICAESRSRTGVTSPAFPIEVTGIARRWSMQTPDWPATAVSAHLESHARCNGVAFAVDEANFRRFDEREQGYDRIQVPWDQVQSLSDQALPNDSELWAYVGHHSRQPTPERPIMQSYVDVILNGCLDYGEAFAERFLTSTELWQHLVNDREAPKYPRPLKSSQRWSDIDGLLHAHLPSLLVNR